MLLFERIFFCFQVLTAFALLMTAFKCLLNKQCAR
jgi:hypothetical protein